MAMQQLTFDQRARLLPRTRSPCEICKKMKLGAPTLKCDRCKTDHHVQCLDLSPQEAMIIETFYCPRCLNSDENLHINIAGLRNENTQPDTAKDLSHDKDISRVAQPASPQVIRPPLPFRIVQSTVQGSRATTSTTNNSEPVPSTSRGPVILTESEESSSPSSTNRSKHLSDSDNSTEDECSVLQGVQRKGTTNKTGRSEEYLVDKILDLKVSSKTTKYKIKWATGEITWEPEANCEGCVNKINKFREKKGLEPCGMPQKFGAVDENEINPNNHVTMDQILKAIKQFDRVKDDYPPVEPYSTLRKQPTIQLIGIDRHIFVIYHSVFSGVVYIADGSDFFIESQSVKNKITQLLGQTPIGIKFVGQNKLDYCASSAVLIALEFRRLFRAKQEPSLLKAERTIYERVQKVFHPEDSKTIQSLVAFRNLTPDICPQCGKQFFKRNRRAYSGHILKCSANI